MFDLEKSIGQWRKQLSSGGAIDRAALDELESHLRESVAEQIRAGRRPEKGFQESVKNLGNARNLRMEFQKEDSSALGRHIIWTVLALCGLVAAYSTLTLEMPLAWKVAGFINAAALLFGFPLARRLGSFSLSAPSKTAISLLALAGGGVGIVASVFFLRLALVRFDLPEGQISVFTMWMLTFLAVMGGLTSWAIEQLSRRCTLQT